MEKLLNKMIRKITELIFDNILPNRIVQMLENGGDNFILYKLIEQSMNDAAELEPVNSIREQFLENNKVILEELKQSISSRDLNLLNDLDQQMDIFFENGEVPEEQRKNIKEIIKYFILKAIRDVDPDFYNNLWWINRIEDEKEHLREQNQQIMELYQMIKKIQEMCQEEREKVTSPITISSIPPQIDNVQKIVKRTKKIEEIKECFEKGCHEIFLVGRPGMGKTTLAKCFANSEYKNGEVYFVEYQKSIKDTIGKLGKKKEPNSEDKILNYWRQNKEIAKRTLLIIDNFDEDPLQGSQKKNFQEELNSDYHKELRNSGIRIIFTTRINVENNTVEVKEVEDTYRLFLNYYERAVGEEESLIREIIRTLKGNTLLIILVANLMKRYNGLQEYVGILERLRTCTIKEYSTEHQRILDRIPEANRIIYQQASALLDMSGILENETSQKVFANTILLPLGGMAKGAFIKLAGLENDNMLTNLINGSWVLYDAGKIYVHPVVREIAISKNIVIYSLCKTYCKNIKDAIDIDKKFEERLRYKDYALELYQIFSSLKPMNATLVELFYNLGDICDKQEDWSKSKEIVMTFLNNIDVLEENCYKKARRISGIAYSLNNDYENMEMIKQAEDMLYKALGLMDSKEKVLPEEKMDYINAKGNILSNFGSNSLAKRKYYEEKCMEPLKQALNYHKEALEFRENQYEHLSMAPEKDRKNVRLGIATSYTTIATDCFYLKDYKKAIENHLKAIKIREELGNEVGKNINQQRIIGCVLNLYRENFAIDKKYLSLVLEYYPQLLISNQEYNKRVSLQENIERFIYIMRIINNDRRYKGLIETAKEKCKAILEWLNQDEELKKSMKDYVQELEKYVNQYIEENI